MKSQAKAKRRSTRVRRAAPATRRSHRPTQAYRNHVAAKSSTKIAQEGAAVPRLEPPASAQTVAPPQTVRPDRDEGGDSLGQEGDGGAQRDGLEPLGGTEPDKRENI